MIKFTFELNESKICIEKMLVAFTIGRTRKFINVRMHCVYDSRNPNCHLLTAFIITILKALIKAWLFLFFKSLKIILETLNAPAWNNRGIVLLKSECFSVLNFFIFFIYFLSLLFSCWSFWFYSPATILGFY